MQVLGGYIAGQFTIIDEVWSRNEMEIVKIKEMAFRLFIFLLYNITII